MSDMQWVVGGRPKWLNDLAQGIDPSKAEQPDLASSRIEAMAMRIEELTQALSVALARLADVEDSAAQLTHDVAHLRAPKPEPKREVLPARALRFSR